MGFSRFILRVAGWRVRVSAPDYPKAIICVAPHTSNWDFIIGKLAYASVNRKAGFLMKKSWFFFPLGYIFRAMGGIPVSRGKDNKSSVDNLVKLFNEKDKLTLAITPEGTRSLTQHWRTGFLNIARMPISRLYWLRLTSRIKWHAWKKPSTLPATMTLTCG